MWKADVVDDGIGGYIRMCVRGRDAAGGAGDDDTKGAGHAETICSGRAMDGMAGLDPSVRGLEIENGRLGWMLIRRGVERGGQVLDSFPKVEGDADYRTGSIGHTQSIADSRQLHYH